MTHKEQKHYLFTRDDESLGYGKIDVSSWEPGEIFIGFSTGEDFPEGEEWFLYYPWQGETKIDHRYENGRLWVNGRIVGVDLREVRLDEIEDRTAILTAKALPSHLAQLNNLLSLLALELLEGKGDLSALAGLTNLRRLRAWPPITNEDLVYIRNLKDLRKLHLMASKGLDEISDAGVKNLSELNKLRELLLIAESTEITDRGVKYLQGLKRLETLGLPGRKITDAALMHLQDLENLQRLYLAHTGITDTGLMHLKEFPNLTEISLSHTEVTDEGIKHLVGLNKLKYINLRGTAVAERDVETLRNSNPGCKVNC